jgi:hypothetical protein
VDVSALLRAALGERANWTAALTAAEQRLVTLREGGRANELTIHPLSHLAVRQSVVPLGVEIDRFGNARPSGERRFEISSVWVNDVKQTTKEVSEHFAPAQFFDLSDDEKLSSRPAFEEMSAGVQIGADKPAFGTPLAMALEYEEIIVDPQKNESVRSAEPSKLGAETLAQMAHWAAVGQSRLRRSGRSKYRAAGFDLTFEEPRFALASIVDLSVEEPSDTNLTYTEAKERLRRKSPGHAKQLQVVRNPK